MVAPATTIVLGSSSGNLTITIDGQGVGEWCHVHLLVPGTGEETITAVGQKIRGDDGKHFLVAHG